MAALEATRPGLAATRARFMVTEAGLGATSQASRTPKEGANGSRSMTRLMMLHQQAGLPPEHRKILAFERQQRQQIKETASKNRKSRSQTSLTSEMRLRQSQMAKLQLKRAMSSTTSVALNPL